MSLYRECVVELVIRKLYVFLDVNFYDLVFILVEGRGRMGDYLIIENG